MRVFFVYTNTIGDAKLCVLAIFAIVLLSRSTCSTMKDERRRMKWLDILVKWRIGFGYYFEKIART